jgi:hypothetical protein
VHLRLLLLCVRVLWRGEAADLRNFLNIGFMTRRQTDLAAGFLFFHFKSTGGNNL